MPESGAAAAPPSAPRPPGRSWGFTVQLYALRSRGSWGHGDLRDLADLAAWSGRGLGAGFVLCSPLHAAEPKPPVTASPYLPMSRRFTSPLYLRIEDIPEYGRLGAAGKEQIAALAAPLRARNATADLIDRDAVWAAKRAACEILWAAPEDPARRAGFERFRARQGRALDDWATWCALAEVHGPDWRELAGQAARSAVRRGRRGAGQAGRGGQLPRLAAMAGRRAARRRAAGRARGRHGHRDHSRPGGRRAPGRRGRLGRAGRDRPGRQRGRAAGRVQPGRAGLDAAALAPGPAGGPGLPAAGRADRRHPRPRRRDPGRSRHGPAPAVVGAGRDDPGPRHLRPVRPRGDGRRAGQPGGAGRRARRRRGSRHRRALDPPLPGRPRCARHLDALVRAPCRRHPAAAGRVAPRLPGHRRHPRRAARGRLRHRRARGAARPSRAARPGPRMPNGPTRPPPSTPGEARWRGRACSPRAQP